MIIEKTKEIFEKLKLIKNKYNKEIEKAPYILFGILLLIGIIGFLINKETMIIVPMLLIFMGAVIYCLKDVRNRIVLLTFLGCFFTFMMSQYVTINTGIPLHRDTFPTGIRVHTTMSVFLSVVALVVAHYLIEFIYKKKHQDEKKEENYYLRNNEKKIKLVAKYGYYITAIFAIIALIERISFSNAHGYLGYIASFASKLPFIITYIGGCIYVLFFVFLSTTPSKKELTLPCFIYIIYLFLTLLTRSRNTFVLGIINLILAIIIREFKVEKKERLINKKRIIIFCSILPIAIFLLNVYNTTRNSVEMENKSFLTNINNFFANQGTSISVISLEKQYHEQAKVKRYPYVLYSIVKEVEITFGKDWHSQIKATDDIENKLFMQNSLGQKVSYYYHKEKIAEGYGLGSNYIAEAYTDAGYIGVVIINLLFGSIIFLFNKWLYKNWILYTVALTTILSFMYLPRDPAFNWLNSITSINLWLIIATIYIITQNDMKKMRDDIAKLFSKITKK